jgi:hypothetical protein
VKAADCAKALLVAQLPPHPGEPDKRLHDAAPESGLTALVQAAEAPQKHFSSLSVSVGFVGDLRERERRARGRPVRARHYRRGARLRETRRHGVLAFVSSTFFASVAPLMQAYLLALFVIGVAISSSSPWGFKKMRIG